MNNEDKDIFLLNKKRNHISKKVLDKCFNCVYNDTSCPGGMWCNKED